MRLAVFFKGLPLLIVILAMDELIILAAIWASVQLKRRKIRRNLNGDNLQRVSLLLGDQGGSDS